MDREVLNISKKKDKIDKKIVMKMCFNNYLSPIWKEWPKKPTNSLDNEKNTKIDYC